MTDEEFDHYLDQASAELEAKQQALEDGYGIGTWERFQVDYVQSKLEFFEGDQLRAQARILPIGTHVLTPGVFQWSWANKQLPEAVRADSARLKGLYDLTDLDFFRNQRVTSDENMCWQTSAMACKFLGALGAYRVPHGHLHAYMLITQVHRVD